MSSNSNPKSLIIKSLQKVILQLRSGQASGVEIKLEIPERTEFGDYSTNIAMQIFAQQKSENNKQKVKNNARAFAQHLVDELQKDENLKTVVSKITVAGSGFINFTLSNDALLDNLMRIDDEYGQSGIGKGKTVVIDYSAPNIAKPFGIGHLSSTIIGQALYNIYKYSGYKVIGDNHLGDWGTQFGKLLYMLDEIKGEQSIDGLSINDLEKLYVDFHQRAENNPDMESGAREWFKKLEDGDPIARKLWKKCVDISLKEFDRIYEMLNVKIDYALGESFYEEEMKKMINEFESGKLKGLSDGEDGAKIIDLTQKGVETPLMFLKADGATTYATRDLACIRFRVRKWNPDIIIYEVGVQQKLHFQQVFAAARLLGLVGDDVVLFHTNHGWYLGPDGKKFSTREGKTVKLEEILLEAIERAKKLGCEDQKTAKAVGLGAIKYYNLMRSVQTDVVFDWNKILNMEGNSGPYLQYTYARTRSVLEKSKIKNQKSKIRKWESDVILGRSEATTPESNLSDFGFPISDLKEEELSVMKALLHFPEIVEFAAVNYAPNLVCNYLYDLAQKFNGFYNAHKILTDNQQELEFRLKLTNAVGMILKSGLNLLGIEAPDRM